MPDGAINIIISNGGYKVGTNESKEPIAEFNQSSHALADCDRKIAILKQIVANRDGQIAILKQNHHNLVPGLKQTLFAYSTLLRIRMERRAQTSPFI